VTTPYAIIIFGNESCFDYFLLSSSRVYNNFLYPNLCSSDRGLVFGYFRWEDKAFLEI